MLKSDITQMKSTEEEFRQVLKALKTGQPIYSCSHSLNLLMESQIQLNEENETLKANLDKVKSDNNDLQNQITQ